MRARMKREYEPGEPADSSGSTAADWKAALLFELDVVDRTLDASTASIGKHATRGLASR
jgi:hypothetical protein